MRPRRLSKSQLFGLFVLGLFAVHYLFFRAPSEAQMIAKFHQRKAEFEQIRLMLKQDKNVETIGSNWVDARSGDKNGNQPEGVELHELPLNISQSRIDLYRSRLKALGVLRVDSDKRVVKLVQFGGGFTDTTWSIGYIYSPKPLKPLVKSAYYQMPGRDRWHYSRVEGNWYIYHRR